MAGCGPCQREASVRAIIVDPGNRTIEERRVARLDHRTIRDLLDERPIELVGLFPGGDVVYTDENRLDSGGQPFDAWEIDGNMNVGKGVLVRVEVRGGYTPPRVRVADLRRVVLFVGKRHARLVSHTGVEDMLGQQVPVVGVHVEWSGLPFEGEG